jgi:hypothetical protein
MWSDPVSLLTVFLALTFAVPPRFTFAHLGPMTPALLCALLALGMWVQAKLDPGARIHRGFQPVRLGLLLFTASSLIGFGVASTRALTHQENAGAIRYPVVMLLFTAVSLVAADGIASRDRLDALLRRLVLFAACVALLGVVEFVIGHSPLLGLHLPGFRESTSQLNVRARSSFSRVAGTAMHPIEYGVVLAAVLPIALHYALHAPAARRQSAWLQAGLVATGVPLAVSRSGVLGVVAGILVIAAGWSGRRLLNFGTAIAVYAAATRLIVPGLLGTLAGLFKYFGQDSSIQERTADYSGIGELLHNHLLLGIGGGTFNPYDYFVLDNQYLGSLVTGGLVGLVALAGLFGLAMGAARGASRRAADAHDAETAHLGRALLASITVFAVTWATFDGFAYKQATGVLFLVIGAAGCLWRLVGRPGDRGLDVTEPVCPMGELLA